MPYCPYKGLLFICCDSNLHCRVPHRRMRLFWRTAAQQVVLFMLSSTLSLDCSRDSSWNLEQVLGAGGIPRTSWHVLVRLRCGCEVHEVLDGSWQEVQGMVTWQVLTVQICEHGLGCHLGSCAAGAGHSNDWGCCSCSSDVDGPQFLSAYHSV